MWAPSDSPAPVSSRGHAHSVLTAHIPPLLSCAPGEEPLALLRLCHKSLGLSLGIQHWICTLGAGEVPCLGLGLVHVLPSVSRPLAWFVHPSQSAGRKRAWRITFRYLCVLQPNIKCPHSHRGALGTGARTQSDRCSGGARGCMLWEQGAAPCGC